jgi:anti-sigma factor RsiW
MNRCNQARHVQDYLDREMSPGGASAFEAHLAGCARCAAEVAAFGAVFSSLGGPALRVADPGPSLTERILDRVLPSRLRARWVTAFGWAYGTASAVTTFGFVSWIVQSSTHVWLAQSYSEASLRLMQIMLLAFQTLTRSWLQAVDGLVFLGAVVERMAPVARALTRPWAEPQLAAIMVAAMLASAAVLWWMRPVRREAMEEIGNVGLLGF